MSFVHFGSPKLCPRERDLTLLFSSEVFTQPWNDRNTLNQYLGLFSSFSGTTVWSWLMKWAWGRRFRQSHSCRTSSTSTSCTVLSWWWFLCRLSPRGRESLKCGHLRSTWWFTSVTSWAGTWCVICKACGVGWKRWVLICAACNVCDVLSAGAADGDCWMSSELFRQGNKTCCEPGGVSSEMMG